MTDTGKPGITFDTSEVEWYPTKKEPPREGPKPIYEDDGVHHYVMEKKSQTL